MATTETGRLCNDVEHAAAQIRTLIGDRTGISEILDLLWYLQDSLSCLVNVDREPGEVSQCRRVIRNVMNALQSPHVQKRATIPGVKISSDKINDLLTRLERSVQHARAASA